MTAITVGSRLSKKVLGSAPIAALLCALFPLCAAAQLPSSESNILTSVIDNADWRTESLGLGVEWRTSQFPNLLGLPQFVSLIEVSSTARGAVLDIAQADSGRITTSELALREGALAAINGSYFESDGKPAVFLQEDGEIVRPDDDGRQRLSEEGAVATEADGDATIIRRFSPSWTSLSNFADVLAAGPLLIWEGEIQSMDPVSFNLTHHPRTAICTTDHDSTILLVADGRNEQSAGLTTYELALFMQALGCNTALNLDGGGSTAMWIAGKGIVNHPSDNRKFDHAGERAVSNALILRID